MKSAFTLPIIKVSNCRSAEKKLQNVVVGMHDECDTPTPVAGSIPLMLQMVESSVASAGMKRIRSEHPPARKNGGER